jgi:hypothetical protein
VTEVNGELIRLMTFEVDLIKMCNVVWWTELVCPLRVSCFLVCFWIWGRAACAFLWSQILNSIGLPRSCKPLLLHWVYIEHLESSTPLAVFGGGDLIIPMTIVHVNGTYPLTCIYLNNYIILKYSTEIIRGNRKYKSMIYILTIPTQVNFSQIFSRLNYRQ